MRWLFPRQLTRVNERVFLITMSHGCTTLLHEERSERYRLNSLLFSTRIPLTAGGTPSFYVNKTCCDYLDILAICRIEGLMPHPAYYCQPFYVLLSHHFGEQGRGVERLSIVGPAGTGQYNTLCSAL